MMNDQQLQPFEAPTAISTASMAPVTPGGSSDPIHVLNENEILMKLAPKDFAKIRRAPGEYFCITDAISFFTECSDHSARKKWSRVSQKSEGKHNQESFPIKFFAFLRGSARGDSPVQEVKEKDGRAVACTNLQGLLTILSQFDHPRCKDLRAKMTGLASRAMVGLPIVLDSTALQHPAPSETIKKPVVRRRKRSLPQTTIQHTASSAEAEARLNKLISILTNPDHPRSKELCTELIALALLTTTGNAVLATKLATVLASSLGMVGGPSTTERRAPSNTQTAPIENTPSLAKPAALPVPEHEQAPQGEHPPGPVAKRPRLSPPQATMKQTTGFSKPAALPETRGAAPEKLQPTSSGLQEIDWDGGDITPFNGKQYLDKMIAEMRKIHPEHEIALEPVYLGFIKPLTNTKHFMTRAQVRAWVFAHRESIYFSDYFDKNGVRKVPFHIDHIIPDSLGGFDHPRNYALMPEVFNQKFASWWMPAKAQYIGATAARSAILFAKYMKKKCTREITLDDLEEM